MRHMAPLQRGMYSRVEGHTTLDIPHKGSVRGAQPATVGKAASRVGAAPPRLKSRQVAACVLACISDITALIPFFVLYAASDL
jgi:hypothetical protein